MKHNLPDNKTNDDGIPGTKPTRIKDELRIISTTSLNPSEYDSY